MQLRLNPLWALVMCCFLLSACSKSNSATLKEVSSWTATAGMVGEAWSNGSVPSAYARRTFETAARQLQQNASDLQSNPDNQQPAELMALNQLQQTIAEMETAVVREDRHSLVQSTQQLAAQKKFLETIQSRTQSLSAK